MIKPEQIPDEALEAAAMVLHANLELFEDLPWEDLSDADQEEYLAQARDACLAMLKAWPGMVLHPGTYISPACVWLPVADGRTVWVTQESANAEG